jgi:DNA-binding MarR family transcriptional regulator
LGEALRKRISQERFESPALEAMLNLFVAVDHLRGKVSDVCGRFGITHGQYNVLRILRGAHPDGHPRCEISRRMIEKAPDVTRLVDRLEAMELVERVRSADDRRLSIAKITPKGLQLLKDMDPEIKGIAGYFSSRVSRRDCEEISRICEVIYQER